MANNADWKPHVSHAMEHGCCIRCGTVGREFAITVKCPYDSPAAADAPSPLIGASAPRGSEDDPNVRALAAERHCPHCNHFLSVHRDGRCQAPRCDCEYTKFYPDEAGETPPAPTAILAVIDLAVQHGVADDRPFAGGPNLRDRIAALAASPMEPLLNYVLRYGCDCPTPVGEDCPLSIDECRAKRITVQGSSDIRQTGTPSGSGKTRVIHTNDYSVCENVATCDRLFDEHMKVKIPEVRLTARDLRELENDETPHSPDGPSPRRGSDEPLSLSMQKRLNVMKGRPLDENLVAPVASPWTFSAEDFKKAARYGGGGSRTETMLTEAAALRSEVEILTVQQRQSNYALVAVANNLKLVNAQASELRREVDRLKRQTLVDDLALASANSLCVDATMRADKVEAENARLRKQLTAYQQVTAEGSSDIRPAQAPIRGTGTETPTDKVLLRCDRCGRREFVRVGQKDKMTQPDGSKCGGIFQ